MEQEVQYVSFDTVSLEAFHTHLFFGAVDTVSAYNACNFIIKSNLLYSDVNLNFIINSTGGECTEGFAIIDTMTSSRLPVCTTGLGNIQSMGVLLLVAGHKGERRLAKNSEVMAHQFTAQIYGKQHELLASTHGLKLLEDRFKKHFLKHTNMTAAQIRDIMFSTTDRYLTPQECKRYGICDKIVDTI